MEFVDWEGRPAVMPSLGKAFAILRDDGPWVPVSWAEVGDSGAVISEAEMRAWVPADRWPPPGMPTPDQSLPAPASVSE